MRPLGDAERAAMYLELERVTKELKEQEWRLTQVQKLISELGMYAKESFLDKMLDRLERADAEALNRQAIIDLIRRVLSLREEKADLEKRLGMKVTFE